MKPFLVTAVCVLFFGVLAHADKIHFESGRSSEGIVTGEDEEKITLQIGVSSFAKFKKAEIRRIERSAPEDLAALKERWAEREKEHEARKKEKKYAPQTVRLLGPSEEFYIEALINGKIKTRLLVDTGCSGFLLSRQVAKKLGIAVTEKDAIFQHIIGDGTRVPAVHVTLESVRVGDVEVRDIQTGVYLKEYARNERFDGLLGMGFLEHFNFTVDSKNKKLILERRKPLRPN